MVRKNPDAVAIAILGLVLLIASVPGMIIHSAPRWDVRPLTVQIPRAERDEIREEVRRGVEEHRQAVKEAIEEVRSAVRDHR